MTLDDALKRDNVKRANLDVREAVGQGSPQLLEQGTVERCAVRYERTDPSNGEKTVRERKSGDVIWHSKGEDAPLLVNAGEKAYRTLVIELK